MIKLVLEIHCDRCAAAYRRAIESVHLGPSRWAAGLEGVLRHLAREAGWTAPPCQGDGGATTDDLCPECSRPAACVPPEAP